MSSVGLEVMNSTNPELNWKTVTKGRRSRKSGARNLGSVVKVGDCTNPKRLGDFFGSDTEKSTSGKSENVPLKKRRHLLQSPPSYPLAQHEDSASQRTHSSSPLSENHGQIQYPSCSSGQRSSSWRWKGMERAVEVKDDGFDSAVLCEQTGSKYDEAGDFSGIELLAAAASMDDIDNADKMCLPLEHSSMPKNSDASSLATLAKGVKNESENTSSNMNVYGGNLDCSQENNSAAASKSLCGSPEDGSVLKVNRQHWDLNTLMDAWDEPYDDSDVGDASKDINDNMHMEGRLECCRDNTRDESSDLKIEERKLPTDTEDVISEPPRLEEPSLEPSKSIQLNAGGGTSDQAYKKNPDDRKLTQVQNCDTDVKNLNDVMSSDAVDCSFTEPFSISGMLMSEEKNNASNGTFDLMQDDHCSSDVGEFERSTAPDGIYEGTQDANALDVTASDSAIDVELKDTENSQVTIEQPGTFTQDGHPVLIAELNKQNDRPFISGSKMADFQGDLAEFGFKHEDDYHCNVGLNRTSTEDPCRSGGVAQCDDPATSVGRIGLPIDGRRDSNISQDHHVHIVNGDDLNGTQEGYDSPYEDGELRGSFLYSWEENELENECVDYESDGRNGNGSDAACCPSSDGSQRSLSLKTSGEGISESGPVKHSGRKHFVKDDSDNNEVAGKGSNAVSGSNAGSGTTVEQCMEMVMDEDGDMKRRQLIDQRGEVDAKFTDMDEYASKMTIRGKLQSRIEGRSCADATDVKDACFMQQCRPSRLRGSYSRAKRDISPDRYVSRYRSTTRERDGVHQWASWGSRRRFTSTCQDSEGFPHTRPRIGESADKIDGVDFHNPRQSSNYLSKGQHRPLMRRSPVERDDYFDAGRRILGRGVSNYRSRRGHYSQHARRHFVEDFEHLPDDVRMPRYLSRRERSFSPGASRSAHMTLPQRRSRSRSGTRSPRAWPPRIMASRRHSSRSPEFRSEARMERMRLPFSKPSFASDYGDGYGGCFSPQRNCGWVDDRNFADDHLRRRRLPPAGVFRRTQRFDAAGSPARSKSDEYLRSAARPRRFSFMANGGRESNYDNRNRDDGGNVRRGVQHDEEFETNKKLNDVPQARVFNI